MAASVAKSAVVIPVKMLFMIFPGLEQCGTEGALAILMKRSLTLNMVFQVEIILELPSTRWTVDNTYLNIFSQYVHMKLLMVIQQILGQFKPLARIADCTIVIKFA